MRGIPVLRSSFEGLHSRLDHTERDERVGF